MRAEILGLLRGWSLAEPGGPRGARECSVSWEFLGVRGPSLRTSGHPGAEPLVPAGVCAVLRYRRGSRK